MKNRNQKMGGTQIEAKALNDLEKSRKKLLSLCNYQNEKNWVGSGFTVGNYPARFILNNRKNNIHKIWKNS